MIKRKQKMTKKKYAATGWPKGREKKLEIEIGSTRSHSLKILLWKRLRRTCHKTEYATSYSMRNITGVFRTYFATNNKFSYKANF